LSPLALFCTKTEISQWAAAVLDDFQDFKSANLDSMEFLQVAKFVLYVYYTMALLKQISITKGPKSEPFDIHIVEIVDGKIDTSYPSLIHINSFIAF
jgi:hypothetical protein